MLCCVQLAAELEEISHLPNVFEELVIHASFGNIRYLYAWRDSLIKLDKALGEVKWPSFKKMTLEIELSSLHGYNRNDVQQADIHSSFQYLSNSNLNIIGRYRDAALGLSFTENSWVEIPWCNGVGTISDTVISETLSMDYI